MTTGTERTLQGQFSHREPLVSEGEFIAQVAAGPGVDGSVNLRLEECWLNVQQARDLLDWLHKVLP